MTNLITIDNAFIDNGQINQGSPPVHLKKYSENPLNMAANE